MIGNGNTIKEKNSKKESISLFEHVFCLPYRGKYIIYFPLRRTIMSANAELVNLLVQSRMGDSESLKKLGLDQQFIDELFESEDQYNHLTRPRQIPRFCPTSVSLFLTSRCTLRCTYCYANGGDRSLDMPLETAQAVLENIVANAREKNRWVVVNFHGGGDLGAAWPLFTEARDYLGKLTKDDEIQVQTTAGLNGFLNDDQRRWVIENINQVTVSVDGPQEIHDLHRPTADGGSSFPVVYDTLKYFDRAGYPYGIRTTVTADSVHCMDEIVEYFCQHFSCKNIKIEPMFHRGRSVRSGVQPPKAVDFIRNFRRARKKALSYGTEIIYSGARLESLTSIFCQAAGDSCAVTPEGIITSCYEVLSPDDPLAEIFFYGRFDHQSHEFVIDEEKRKHLFSLNVLNKPFCAKCFCRWNCAGDCPVKSIHHQQCSGVSEPDRCRINQAITRDQLIEVFQRANNQKRK